MKKLLFFILILSISGIAMSQSCYKYQMDKATTFFRQHNYRKAKECASKAKLCPDASPAAVKEVELFIRNCDNALEANKPEGSTVSQNESTTPTETSSPVNKSVSNPPDKKNYIDVDKNIPVNSKKNNNTFVYIIANEDYPNRNVPYALNDGRVFKEYCEKTLGVPAKQVKIFENATGNNIIDCVEQMKEAAKVFNGDINIVFYYAGHAFPDEETKDAYLMPVDGNSTRVRTCYSLKELYKELGALKSKQVVCFLDACFSGATREDDMMMAGARGVAIKPKEETPQGNLIVFTSASGAETAHQYKEKQHGMFTYFLLKKLQETKGSTTLGELSDYLKEKVQRTSFTENNGKTQNPEVRPSSSMSDKWKNVKL